MGFVANGQDDEYRINAMGSMNPITQLTPDGMFAGTAGAIGTGIVSGAAAVSRAVGDIGAAYVHGQGIINAGDTMQSNADVQKAIDAPLPTAPWDETAQHVQEWAKADPRVQGTGAQVLGATSRGLTIFGLGTLAGGAVGGAATLGVTEGTNDYKEAIAAGVDPETALKKAGLSGVTAAAGAFLPLAVSKGAATGLMGLAMRAEAGGNEALASSLYGAASTAATMSTNLAAKLGTASAVNTGFGVANRYMTSNLLESAGYHDMAEQYKPLDSQALIADAIMGLAFGGWQHVEGRIAAAKETPANRPSADLVQSAIDARRAEMQTRAGPGLPIDPEHANLDLQLQDRAVANMLRGKETDVTADEARRVVEHSVIDPERVQLNDGYQVAGEKVFGQLADFSEPARVEIKPAEYVPAEQRAPVAATEGAATLSPMAQELATQLAARHSDMEVELPNGRTVRAADLHDEIARELAAATNESKLHDVAVACFMRTL